jgi:UDP-glucose 4-epimerase
MKYFITGGAGFIGSHLVDSLSKEDNQIVILDSMATGSEKNLQRSKNINLVKGDIRDAEIVDTLSKNCEVVVHLAASLGVNNILSSTLDSLSTNVFGSEVVLKSAAKYNKRIIIASTSEIYGKNPDQPLTEESDRVVGKPQNIRWTYSDAKAIEEAIAEVLYQEQNLQVTTLRFFNTVGPRQTGRYGMVLPRFVRAALAGDNLEVYGDGLQSRVFCHVDDAVGAVQSVLMNNSTIGQVFNVGGVGEVSILDLAKIVLSITKSKSKIVHIPYNKAYSFGYEDMSRRVPCIDKITNTTGWIPKKNLEDTVTDVQNYFLSNPLHL